MDSRADSIRRLLVVDDEPAQCMMVSRVMAGLGFSADTATSVEEATSRIAVQNYQVIVLDLTLGGREGISLLRLIADNQDDPVVVFITRLDDRVRAASMRFATGLGLRVAGALAKPVGPSALRDLLANPPPPRPPPPLTSAVKPTAAELAHALDRRQIHAAFQPKISLATGNLVGFEALARWRDPPHGTTTPDVFIPIAEQNGLIVPLTRHILEDALAACQRWRTQHPDCNVAVNVSPLVLVNPALPQEIEDLLQTYDLTPDALIAEITESTIIANPLFATELLTRLRIKGIGLSMDDFGTGYSSLLTLMRLPFTELKIDRSFVSACETDEEAWTIIRATISLARELGLSVVAEGIETPSVENRLRSIGCHTGQGWRFGHAMIEDAVDSWLAQHATAT